jgi:oxygen-independent coproporphyrinogen-3 oxidase
MSPRTCACWVVTAELLSKYDRRLPRYTSYPTAPHFKSSVDADVYRSWLQAIPAASDASFYLHVPFCAALCWYCGCHTSVVRSHAPVAEYVALLEAELALVAAQSGRLKATHVHWGGGTPNMLAPDEFDRFMSVFAKHVELSAAAEISVEIDPRRLTVESANGYVAAGMTRASLGVQDFDARVQQAINRLQPFAMTAQAVEWLRRAGITSINFDLIYGLPRQTVPSILDTIDRAMSLAPDRIALFGYAHVPWMKRHQQLIAERDLPGPLERLAQAEAAAARLIENGYLRIGLDHFARPGDLLARQLAEGRLHRNFQGYTSDDTPALIGLGLSAIGSLLQGYVQNTTDITLYRERVRGGELAAVRGVKLSGEDRLRRDIIERLMCEMRVDLARVARKHSHLPEVFAPELAALEPLIADGIARREGWTIAVTEEGRPLARAVCAVFDTYLDPAQQRHARIV